MFLTKYSTSNSGQTQPHAGSNIHQRTLTQQYHWT